MSRNDRHTNRGGQNYIDLTGHRFGKLEVLSDTGRRKSRRPIWASIGHGLPEVHVPA